MFPLVNDRPAIFEAFITQFDIILNNKVITNKFGTLDGIKGRR